MAGKRTAWKIVLPVAATYLVLSVLVWWHVWTNHPSSTTICGCGDPSVFTWFIEWPAYAIAHGHNPLYSTAMFHGGGVNLLDNTSAVAFGVLLAPVTWLFGPVASLNVALTLSPALTALAMFVLLRRWVSWMPAAFVGGLLYGFSPAVIVNVGLAHLMVSTLAIPPLIVICLDELLVRRRYRAVTLGIILAALLTVQFFVGTELLLILVLTGLIGVGLVAVYGLVRNPSDVRVRLPYIATGFGATAGATLVLLAYPVWFALDGPAHLPGAIWGDIDLSQVFVTYVPGLLVSYPPDIGQRPSYFGYAHMHAVGGYQGPLLSDQFFGYGIVFVLLIGLVFWRRDLRLWLFATLAAVSVSLSRGVSSSTWTPWRLLAHLPLFQNIIPERILAVTWLSVAVMLGLVMDHARTSFNQRRQRALGADGSDPLAQVLGKAPAWIGIAVALLLAAIAIAPPARYLA
jgi:hypothetical protein